jgi:anti-sigma regulatory factor (Ser/Thr protein kinase)
VQGLACDRCGRWEVGIDGVAEPGSWASERSGDAHLCPRCVIDRPAWTRADVEALAARTTRALARAFDLQAEFQAVQAQALQARRVRARRPTLTVALPAVPSSVTIARRLVTVFAAGTGVRPDDLGLLTSEIVTNAVRHAGLPTDEQVAIHARLDGAAVHVSVQDRGPGVGALLGPVPMAPAPGGRGLHMVDAVAAGWGSGPGAVWFRLDAAPGGRVGVGAPA